VYFQYYLKSVALVDQSLFLELLHHRLDEFQIDYVFSVFDWSQFFRLACRAISDYSSCWVHCTRPLPRSHPGLWSQRWVSAGRPNRWIAEAARQVQEYLYCHGFFEFLSLVCLLAERQFSPQIRISGSNLSCLWIPDP